VSDGGRKWNVCVPCHNAHNKSARKPRSRFQSNLNETLTKDLLSLDHTFSQTLSAIDASVSFTHKVSGYFTGAPSKSSLFESPLLMYNVDRSLFYTDPPPDLTSFYNNHLHSCPALQTFRPVLQRTHPTLGIPYLAESEIDLRLARAAADRAPTDNASQQATGRLAAVVPIDIEMAGLQHRVVRSTVGNLELRSSGQLEQFLIDLKFNSITHTRFKPETLIFPMLFPSSEGAFEPVSGTTVDGVSLKKYLDYRMNQMFSAFTLYKPYLPIMYAARRTQEVLESVSESVLTNELKRARASNPSITDSELYQRLIRNVSSSSVEGSPAFFRIKKSRLLAAARKFGMPHFFLTLTADEISNCRWPEVDDLIERLQKVNPKWTPTDSDKNQWQHAPVEITQLFNFKLNLFMDKYVKGNGLLGRVQHYCIKIEFQSRGTPHAHICIWTHPSDVDRIANQIVGITPSSSMSIPADSALSRLDEIVRRKHIHSCYWTNDRPKACVNANGCCKMRFPCSLNTQGTRFNSTTQRFEYLRLHDDDKNISPYLPSIALIWNAHMNIQRVTGEAWSSYMLKYAMKGEASAGLNLDTTTLDRLGIHPRGSAAQSTVALKLASAACLSQPVGACEAAWLLLGYPLVEFSWLCDFKYSDPPERRKSYVPQANRKGESIPAIEHYFARNDRDSALKFPEYWERYERLPKSAKLTLEQRNAAPVKDKLDSWIVKRTTSKPTVVQFCDPNPRIDPESFFYNLLLFTKIMPSEPAMLQEPAGSPPNHSQTYFQACMLTANIFSTVSDLKSIIQEHFIDKTFRTDEDPNKVIQTIFTHTDIYPWLKDFDYDSADHDEPIPQPDNSVDFQPVPRTVSDKVSDFFSAHKNEYPDDIMNATLNAEQASIVNELQGAAQSLLNPDRAQHQGGMFFLTGGAGCGKTFLCKRFIQWARQNMRVLSAATTGAAAVRLSKHAQTAHSVFALPCKASDKLNPLDVNSFQGRLLVEAQIIIVDEISMLNSKQFAHIMRRICCACGTTDLTLALKSKLVLLVGDLAQLPPVCKVHRPRKKRKRSDHNDSESDSDDDEEIFFCQQCHVTSAGAWAQVKVRKLVQVVRQENDQEYCHFLNKLRHTQPTQQEVDSVLADCFISPEQVETVLADALSANKPVTVLTSHTQDRDTYNEVILQHLAGLPESLTPGGPLNPAKVGEIHDIPLKLTSTGNNTERAARGASAAAEDLKNWIDSPKFQSLKYVAIGARVMLTKNQKSPSAFYANGSFGTVIQLHRKQADEPIHRIDVEFDTNPGSRVAFYCDDSQTWTHLGYKHTKSRFPLVLGYALTVHKSQGMTIPHLCILHMRKCFARGMLYVALSRAKSRSIMQIVGSIKASYCVPIPPEFTAE